MALHPILLSKLNESLSADTPPETTARDAALPPLHDKVHAVIGMRRSGKTTFLRQHLAEVRRRRGKDMAVFIGFDDERLDHLPLRELDALIEEYYRRYPDHRGAKTVSWYFDEIQVVSGWERFARRILDTEKVEVIVSGSSARLLSREIHTSLRGRGWETVIYPFSFREYLRHRHQEPQESLSRGTPAVRSKIERHFLRYLSGGGFPEAQGMAAGEREQLLQGYVDTVLFRDIVERFGISQVAALRWLIRYCLRNPAGLVSIHRVYLDLRAQGYGISKETLHELFAHLVDSFLITAIPISTESERRKNSNPRKVYPIDPGLIGAFDRSGRTNLGHALETAVLNHLIRMKAEVAYLKTEEGFEVDFHARLPGGKELLIQVSADIDNSITLEREVRALESARKVHPKAVRMLLVPTFEQLSADIPKGIRMMTAYEWMLGNG